MLSASPNLLHPNCPTCRLSNSPNLSALEQRLAVFVDQANQWLLSHQLITAAVLLVSSLAPPPASHSHPAQTGSVLFFVFVDAQPAQKPRAPRPAPKLNDLNTEMTETAPEVPQLDAPKDTPFTTAELSKYDGSTEGLPIYVAIKGTIFDGEQSLCIPWEGEELTAALPVSAKKEMYGPGAGYHVRSLPVRRGAPAELRCTRSLLGRMARVG